MPSRVWSHLCDYATIDARGKATIVGEFDNIFVQTLPIQYPLYFVISKWSGFGGESFTLAVKVVSPSGKVLAGSPESAVTMQPMANGEGIHINADSFMMQRFEEAGEYAIEILLNGDPVHILRLNVVQVTG